VVDFKKVSEAPTRPGTRPESKTFDVADLYRGPADGAETRTDRPSPLDEKLRQAYYWIVNTAIISPYYDVEYNDQPPASYTFGDRKVTVRLPTDQSYSSYVLLPLLNLAVRRRCLLVGGPGRGKTVIAVLMALLAGYSLKEVKRSVQHGQPQMTIADLLGNPLPSTLVSAADMDDVKIAWRKWLGMRVKIIDEYNRIPTRTQSALLTVMADNYAEMYDHIFECPEASWYLTANDEAGGGTYQVIEALRDRIDVVVGAFHFNTRFLNDLLLRIEAGIRPEEIVPAEIVFTEAEQERMSREVLGVGLPGPIRRRIEFFSSHFEFFEPAAAQLEYMTKDTVKLAGVDPPTLAVQESGKDPTRELGRQTNNGLSVRALMTALVYIKAMAWFRGRAEVELEDVRQILPFVLHDKLVQDPEAPFFERPENEALRTDRVSWVRRLFDESNREYDRLDLDKDDPVARFEAEFEKGLEGLAAREVEARLVKIERTLAEWAKGRKFHGHMYDDVLKLKYLHQRYSNYLRWKRWTA